MRMGFKRYSSCVGDLPALNNTKLNSTEYLVHQVKTFLDAAYYDRDQLENVTELMDLICQNNGNNEQSYIISGNIDVSRYESTKDNEEAQKAAKQARCNAIDTALDSMYPVFKRAATNKSEPLDFSVIRFHPNASSTSVYYNLTDLINTSWIKANFMVDDVCKITDSVKLYVHSRASTSAAQDRSQQQPPGLFYTLLDIIDGYLDPILGLQKRLYWESTNRLEMVYNSVSYQLSKARNRVVNIFSAAANSTLSANTTLVNNTSKTVPNQLVYASTTFKPVI